MWQKIKCWLGIKDHYFVSYEFGGDKIEKNDIKEIKGFGSLEIISEKPLNYDTIKKMEKLIQKTIPEKFPDIENCVVIILNIIKLER